MTDEQTQRDDVVIEVHSSKLGITGIYPWPARKADPDPDLDTDEDQDNGESGS